MAGTAHVRPIPPPCGVVQPDRGLGSGGLRRKPGGPAAEGHGIQYVEWWLALSASATVALVAAGRLVRRLLPLAALMRLSLVFPDGAPSRFRMALHSGPRPPWRSGLRSDASPPIGRRLSRRSCCSSSSRCSTCTTGSREATPSGFAPMPRASAGSWGSVGTQARPAQLGGTSPRHRQARCAPRDRSRRPAGRRTPSGTRSRGTRSPARASPSRCANGSASGASRSRSTTSDGTAKGYPRGLAGPEISLAGRIVAVADVYDVMTSSRSYRDAGSTAEARQELARCAGTQFDPTVVRAFLGISIRSRRLVSGPLAWLAHGAGSRTHPAVTGGRRCVGGSRRRRPSGRVGAGRRALVVLGPGEVGAGLRHRSVALSPSISRPTDRAVPSAHAGAARLTRSAEGAVSSSHTGSRDRRRRRRRARRSSLR